MLLDNVQVAALDATPTKFVVVASPKRFVVPEQTPTASLGVPVKLAPVVSMIQRTPIRRVFQVEPMAGVRANCALASEIRLSWTELTILDTIIAAII